MSGFIAVCAALLVIPMLLSAQREARFADEFNGSDVDLAKWVPHDPLQTAGNTPDLPAVSGGLLHLGRGQVMTTFGLFSQTFGRFEIRARMAAGARFRLLPVPLAKLPSIEVFSAAQEKISFGNSWGDDRTERWFGDSFGAPAEGFHVIAAEWNPGKITWSVDGMKRLESVDGVPESPLFVEIAGPMDVDYIRISVGN